MSDSLIVTLTSFLSHDNCGHVGSIKICDCETCSHCIAVQLDLPIQVELLTDL